MKSRLLHKICNSERHEYAGIRSLGFCLELILIPVPVLSKIVLRRTFYLLLADSNSLPRFTRLKINDINRVRTLSCEKSVETEKSFTAIEKFPSFTLTVYILSLYFISRLVNFQTGANFLLSQRLNS